MLARPAAETFARDVIAYDDAVGASGWQAGGATLVKRYVGGLKVAGVENIPREGPTLILSNHPGLTDSVALFASIPRNDLRPHRLRSSLPSRFAAHLVPEFFICPMIQHNARV